jgi:hypothetical protein
MYTNLKWRNDLTAEVFAKVVTIDYSANAWHATV